MRKFQTGKVVKSSDFLGRDKILKELNLYIEMGQSVVLIAPRRFGKTSLITKIIDMQNTKYKSISVDLMKTYSKRLLAEHIIDEVYKIMGIRGVIAKLKDVSISFFQDLTNHLTSLKVSIDDVEVATTAQLLKEKDEDKLLEFALDLPNLVATKMGIKIIFSIDEFGEIDKFQSKSELLEKMRSIFQHHENVVFMFAGSQYALMTKIFTQENSAFYKFAIPVQIPTMKAKEFEKLFKEVFFNNEVSIPENFAKEIEEVSKGIPYYMVRIAQQVLIDAKLNDKINVYCFSVIRAALKVYYKEHSYFSSELSKIRGKRYDFIALEALARDENHTSALAKFGVSRQNANKILNSLLSAGFIEKNDGYKIVDPFLARYVRALGK